MSTNDHFFKAEEFARSCYGFLHFEYEMMNFINAFLCSLKDEVLKIMPVQKQTRAGQRTRFKAFVAIGDNNGHVGLGVKCSKEVSYADSCLLVDPTSFCNYLYDDSS